MKKQSLESHRDTIIKKLQEAGHQGLSKTELGIKKKFRLKHQAFTELESTQQIANLGNQAKTQYVLKEFYMPLETACCKIEKLMRDEKKKLFSRSKIKEVTKNCPIAVRAKIDEAVEILVDRKKIIKFFYGRTELFSHVRSILPRIPVLSIIPEGVPEEKPEVEKENNEFF